MDVCFCLSDAPTPRMQLRRRLLLVRKTLRTGMKAEAKEMARVTETLAAQIQSTCTGRSLIVQRSNPQSLKGSI